MQQHNVSVRRRTTIAQKLPADFNAKLLEFQQYIMKMRRQHSYDVSLIGNADQMSLTSVSYTHLTLPTNREV